MQILLSMYSADGLGFAVALHAKLDLGILFVKKVVYHI